MENRLINLQVIGGDLRQIGVILVLTKSNGDNLIDQFPDAAVALGHHGNYRYSQRILQCSGVNFDSLIGSYIKHINGNNDRTVQ